MPYKLKGNCVVKADTGQVVKCHKSRKKAVAHLAALEINVHESAPSPRPLRIRKDARAALRIVLESGWTEALHPRGPDGKFIHKAGKAIVRWQSRAGPRGRYAGKLPGGIAGRASTRTMAEYSARRAAGSDAAKAAATGGRTAGRGAAYVIGRTLGEKDSSVIRNTARLLGDTARHAVKTKRGRYALLGVAGATAAGVVSRSTKGARKQLDHQILIKWDRDSRIAWRKEQRIYGRDGKKISPGDEVLVGKTRRKMTYLGGEQDRRGRLWTTNGRMLVQDGKGKIRSVKYSSIMTGGKSRVEPATARQLAEDHSKASWNSRLDRRRTKSSAKVAARHFTLENRMTKARIRKELQNDIRNLRNTGGPLSRASAKVLSRIESQFFSKQLRRQRRWSPRPKSRARYAQQRIREGRPRPKSGRRQSDYELARQMHNRSYEARRHHYGTRPTG